MMENEIAKKIPAYQQVYRMLKEQIIDGSYRAGSRLPSRRMLAERMNVSEITAQHALELLCEEGYASPRERSGIYVTFSAVGDPYTGSGVPIRKASPSKAILPPGHFPMSVLAKHMRRVISEEDEHILESAPSGGCEALREALAAYLSRARRIHVSASQIVFGAGSEHLYGLIIATLGRQRIYACENPSYEKIAQVYDANGITVEPLTLTRNGIDSAALSRSTATVLHVTPYRSYPSGITTDASKRHEYIAWANQPDHYLIEDDYSSEFSLSGNPAETLFSLQSRENVIYVNSFSKTIAPSLRAAYMLLPPGLLSLYRQRAGFYSCAVPVFEQLVIASLLNSGDFERHIRRARRMMKNAILPSQEVSRE